MKNNVLRQHGVGKEKGELMSDLISRQAAIDVFYELWGTSLTRTIDAIKHLPSAEPESFEWCTDCKEYDQESHCCHRWSKVIRKTVEEMQIVRCKDCKYYNSEEKECLDLLGHGRRWEEDDFCSYGAEMEVTT